MSRSNTGSTSNRFTNTATVPVSAAPLTLACWVNPANLTSNQNLVFISNAGFSNYFGLIWDGANANAQGDNVFLASALQVGESFGVSPSGGAAGTWMHGAAVFASATSRTAYLNGVAGTANTTSQAPSGVAGTHIGSLSTFSPLNGSMAEVAIWDVALTTAEIASLAKGFSPVLIRPNNLVRYWPLMGVGTETCLITRQTLTTTGTMAKAAHVPVSRPHLPIVGIATGAGSQSITGALFTDADTFFGATVGRGAVDIGGALFANANAFFGATVSATYSITGALYDDADTFYGSTVAAGAVNISGSLFSDGDTFYAASIGRGAVDISGALFTDADTFYASTVSQAGAPQAITGALFTGANTFYGSTVAASYSIAGALYSDADTFFGATLSSTFGITGSLVADPDTFFAASVVADGTPQAITGNLYANDNTFFGATVGGNVVPLPITPGGGFAEIKGRKRWRHWEEDEEAEVRKIAKAKVVGAIQSGLLVELTRAGVKAYTAQTVERLVPEISDEALNEITARITASLHRVIAQQRQEDDDEEALLLSA